MVNKIFKYI